MIHLPALIKDLALILGAAAIVTLIFKRFRQPVVLGYIIAGLLVGPNFKLFFTVVEIESIRTWAEIGVIFLLFGLGIEFSFRRLIEVGAVALFTAFTGAGLTMLVGYAIGQLQGWGIMDSVFFGGVLAIASTTIIIRAFEEQGVKTQKFTGIVTGILIVEDLFAVILMVVLSTLSIRNKIHGAEMASSIVKLSFFLVLWFVSGIFFLPTLLKALRRLLNAETLLILSLALCFLMVYLASEAGFSPALGAFIMGSILAETTKAEKIEELVKPVKDLFGAIFFVSVGMLIDPRMMLANITPILIGTLVLLVGKPLFVTLGALTAGQPLKMAVQTGMSLSQIGEFSFIIATLGISLNVTGDFLYPVAVAISVITTFSTPYMIRYSPRVAAMIEARIPEKTLRRLTRYSVGAQNVTDMSDWKKLLRFYLLNIVVFSVIIVSIISLSVRYIQPLFSAFSGSRVITAIITLIIMAPFLWALAFRRMQRQAYANVWVKPAQRGPLLLLMLLRIALAVYYIGLLFERLYSRSFAVAGIIISGVLILVLYKRIRNFYGRIELRFLSNLNEREENNDFTHTLAPWDTHLSRFELTPQSPYIGKTLQESMIREEFGVNIAIIERGDLTINVPSREERLYPYDKISVIGTDEQLRDFKNKIESSGTSDAQYFQPRQSVSLHHFVITRHSALLGKSIRHSGIRERTKGLVVGVERDGQRILNPESDLVFQMRDIIWVVGNARRIIVLAKEER